MKSEYISLSIAMRSLVYWCGLLFEVNDVYNVGLQSKLSKVSTVLKDNCAAQILTMMDPPCMTPHSNSLAALVKYYWFPLMLLQTRIMTKSVPSEDNTSDIFTKALPFDTFRYHCKTICGC